MPHLVLASPFRVPPPFVFILREQFQSLLEQTTMSHRDVMQVFMQFAYLHFAVLDLRVIATTVTHRALEGMRNERGKGGHLTTFATVFVFQRDHLAFFFRDIEFPARKCA